MKPLCSSSIRKCWRDRLWLGTRSVSLLDFLFFRFVSSLFSACLIFFPLSESIAIESASYSDTVSQPRSDLSSILINLFLLFWFCCQVVTEIVGFAGITIIQLWIKIFNYLWNLLVKFKLYFVPFMFEFESVLHFRVLYFMVAVTFSVFSQNFYRSSSSLTWRSLDCLEFRGFFFSFYRFCQWQYWRELHLFHFQKFAFFSCSFCC